MSNGGNVQVPEGWEVRKLSNIGKCVRGLTYSPDDVVPTGLLVLRSSNIQKDSLSFKDNVYVNLEVNEKFLTKDGDILICVRNGSRNLLGKSAFIKGDRPVSTHGAFMTVFRGGMNEYVQHLIKSNMFFIQVSRDVGATINSINNGNLLEYKFPIPPLPEQKKIASILTSVDDVIEKTVAQISKLQDLKKGMMTELLTKGIGHTEFKDSPVGRIPVSWEVNNLGAIISSMVGGVSVNSDNREKTSSEIGILKTSSVSSGYFYPIEHKVVLPDEIQRAKVNPTKDHILFSRMNTPLLVGESGYVEDTYTDLFLPDRLWMIDVKDRKKINVRWLSYVLASGATRQKISDVATGTSGSMKNISKPNLLAIKVGIPSINEQDKIAKSISSLDVSLNLKQNKLSHTKSLKKALMNDLLTGKKRVTIDN